MKSYIIKFIDETLFLSLLFSGIVSPHKKGLATGFTSAKH
jgi:hypothetical protein